MARLWIYLGSIPAVAALSFGTLQTIGVLAHEETTVTQSFAVADVESLRVDNENGSVEITGGDVDEITVEARVSRGLQATGQGAYLDGTELVLVGECPSMPSWCSVDYTVTVPTDLPITADVDDGRLTLRELDGAITADVDHGRIELIRLGGEVRVQNDSGAIEGVGLRSSIVDADTDEGRLLLQFAAAPEFVTATSDRSSVGIVVPDDEATYRVDARTGHGTTDIGIRTDPASDRSITAHTDHGSVTVRYPTG